MIQLGKLFHISIDYLLNKENELDEQGPVNQAEEVCWGCQEKCVSFFVSFCNGVQREHNKKLNNGLPILHKVPPKRDYGRYFCILAEKVKW